MGVSVAWLGVLRWLLPPVEPRIEDAPA
jgi:hypothetical protein